MFESMKKDGQNTVLYNSQFEVKIIPRIYGGCTLQKTVRNKPLTIIEIREIRLPLSEKEILKEARSLLKQNYESIDFHHYNIQTI